MTWPHTEADDKHARNRNERSTTMGFADKLKDKHGDPNDYEASEDAFSGGNLDLPVKPGTYHVEILPDHTAEQDTSKGGEMLTVQCKIKGPKYAGRHMFFRFIYDCPSNEEFEDDQIDRLMWLAKCCGITGAPSVSDWAGCQFIAQTGLEVNEYKGEVEYQPTLWGAAPLWDGPADGPYPDGDQPDIWHDAVAFAKGQYDPRDGKSGGGSTSGGGAPQSSYDEDDVPF